MQEKDFMEEKEVKIQEKPIENRPLEKISNGDNAFYDEEYKNSF